MREFMNRTQTKRFFQRLLLAVAVIASYKMIMNLSSVLTWLSGVFKIFAPFVYGFVIAYLLNIPTTALEKQIKKMAVPFLAKRARGLSVLVVYLLSIALIIIVVNIAVPSLQTDFADFSQNFNTYYNTVVAFIDQLPLEQFGGLDAVVDNLLAQINWRDMLENFAAKYLRNSLTAVLGLTNYIISAFIAIICSVYFLLEAQSFKAYTQKLLHLFIPLKTKSVLLRYAYIINDSFKKFIVCQVTDSCILLVITSIEFALLGSRYALALAALLAVGNLIPYFGSIFASILASLIMAVTNGISSGIITGIVLLVTQQIDGNIIQPRLMSTSFSLSPVLILIGITVGGAAGGIWGMILAIPIVNILKSIINDIVTYKEESLALQGSEPEDTPAC